MVGNLKKTAVDLTIVLPLGAIFLQTVLLLVLDFIAKMMITTTQTGTSLKNLVIEHPRGAHSVVIVISEMTTKQKVETI